MSEQRLIMLETDAKPKKTADEMLSELGYEKYERDDGTLLYILDCQLKAIVVKTCDIYFLWNTPKGWENAPATFPEIRAACKLLDEMGVE